MGAANEDKWDAHISHCDACRAISRAAHIEQGRDDLDKMAGVRFSVTRDSVSGNGSA